RRPGVPPRRLHREAHATLRRAERERRARRRLRPQAMTDRRALAALALVHLAIVAMVQTRGDFPLNDDWAYAHSVGWLLDEGRIRLSDWVGNNLVPQTLAGAAVSSVAGFSFEALRHLTQAVALAAAGAAYFWFRSARFAPAAALAATLAIVAFPAWPVLANSYMTDLYG